MAEKKEKEIVVKRELVGVINPGTINPHAFVGQDEVLMPRGNPQENFLVMRESLIEQEIK
jgi:hypothetical protein